MKFQFKPDDFGSLSNKNAPRKGGPGIQDAVLRKYACDVANALLEEYLKTCPRVYGQAPGASLPWYRDSSGEKYTAILFNVEAIEGDG